MQRVFFLDKHVKGEFICKYEIKKAAAFGFKKSVKWPRCKITFEMSSQLHNLCINKKK